MNVPFYSNLFNTQFLFKFAILDIWIHTVAILIIRIHVRLISFYSNTQLFKIQNGTLIEIIQNAIFIQNHHNVKENVAKCARHIKKT